jgi:alkanesulfonate monooxygenase SsuD/methylene tetrahydromethanopterin reductase-like flavin-dependent oxidoreductase (luciferase family)
MAAHREIYGGPDKSNGRFFETTLDAFEDARDSDYVTVRFEWQDTADGRLGNREVGMPKDVALRLGQWLVLNSQPLV